jgi:hypothetical protein
VRQKIIGAVLPPGRALALAIDLSIECLAILPDADQRDKSALSRSNAGFLAGLWRKRREILYRLRAAMSCF